MVGCGAAQVKNSEATVRAPDFFSASIFELIRAAEKRGAWDEILAEIVDGLDEGTFT